MYEYVMPLSSSTLELQQQYLSFACHAAPGQVAMCLVTLDIPSAACMSEDHVDSVCLL